MSFLEQGTVYAITVVDYDMAPKDFKQFAPYSIGIVDLDNGIRLTTRFTDLGEENLTIGQRVEPIVRKMKEDGGERGMIVYGTAFRPIMNGKNSSSKS